jgi:hypothetical protein
MTTPDSVPARAYLLAYDRERQRFGGRMWLGYTLRGAALADLWATGHLTDTDGRPATGTRPPADPVLRAVWTEIAEHGPRSWESWVKRNRGATDTAIRTQLAADRCVRVIREPTWWRPAKIEISDPRVFGRLDARVGATLRGPTPIARVHPRDTALVAVLVTGDVRTGISKAQRREHATRIDAAVAAAGPAVAGLKRALRQARSQAA